MTVNEIKELMRRKGWTKTRLAAELELSEHAVVAWLSKRNTCAGPAAILMRQWLTEAREANNTVKAG